MLLTDALSEVIIATLIVSTYEIAIWLLVAIETKEKRIFKTRNSLEVIK